MSLEGSARQPRFQLVTCIDEREESFRRHLEEVAPDCETFGAPGFFGVVMYHRGVGDAHYVPLCPIVVTPKHYVAEQVEDTVGPEHERRARARRALGRASLGLNVGTRSFFRGALLSVGLGVLATVPLVARVMFPRLTARFRRRLSNIIQAPGRTQLRLERKAAEPGPAGDNVGLSVAEMTDAADRFLRGIGLVDGFADLVVLLGHGSESPNNPHLSAYNCGACGGSPGAANARAAAQILNDDRVRAGLAGRGIAVPPDTWFVGGVHDTCDDSVTLADTERAPTVRGPDLDRLRRHLAAACDRNAHERTRRFMSAGLDLSPAEARRHVENRSADLAQVRPELGHATNAICIIGRRARTRGLFFDRRAFFNSYDSTRDDPAGTVLAGVLSAAVPVCGGINLEYFFSRVDNPGYGCGTKLPHNITSLLGVMDGAASDLRTGLPWQMVEIHEPVRLLFVVETTPEVVLGIMARDPAIGTQVRNGWVQLAVLDPHSGAIRVFENGAFHRYEPEALTLPHAPTSADWYRGWRDHLPFAVIDPGA